jgi:flagellar hook-associated protein 2
MVSVGSTAKVDAVDHHKVVSAMPPSARPAAQQAAPPEAEQRTDISATGRLKSTAAAMLDVAARLTQPQTWSATKATSSDESVLQAVSDQAKPGSYKVEVDAVALAQATASATFSSISTVVGIGTLKIELGNWNASQTAFATNPNWPKASVTFGPKDNSLERVRDKINSAGVGVIASVVSDATGSRLVLRSTSSGADNGFKAEAETGGGSDPRAAAALAAMGFDPGKVDGAGAKLVQPAQDAQLKIDGRELKSAQNLIEDDQTRLSLRVKSASQKPVEIRVEPDTEAMQDGIRAFAVTYNELSKQLSAFTDAPADEATRGARDIQSRVQKAFDTQDKGKALEAERFQAIGIQMTGEGRLEVDATKMARALREQPEEVERLFKADAGKGEAGGLAQRLADIRLAETPAPAVSTSPAGPLGQTSPGTVAGARFRQKLLSEQYAAQEPLQLLDAARQEGELAFQANEV